MLLIGLAIDQDIIKVNNNTSSNEGLENLVHESHKSASGISKPEWHHKPLVQTSFSLKGGFLFITFKNVNLIIATSKINLRKDSGSV